MWSCSATRQWAGSGLALVRQGFANVGATLQQWRRRRTFPEDIRRGEVQMKTTTQQAASRPGPDPSETVLVDPGWLAGHLNDADLRVVEVDVSPAAYDDWHIDGA